MKTKVVALTGGIGSGKSELSKLIQSHGYTVLSADELSREAMVTPEVISAVSSEFGQDFIGIDGAIDRTKLREHVFADPTRRKLLEALIHPFIASLFKEKLENLESANGIVFYEIPLLFEVKKESEFDAIILVTATPEVKLKRLAEARGLDRNIATKIMSTQLSDDVKIPHCDFVVDNSLDKSHLSSQVPLILKKIQQKFA